MRRKDRECNEQAFFDLVFQKAEVMFIAMHNGDYPYCIPVNFAKVDNVLYIHCAKEGQKLEIIKCDGHVAFSLAIDIKIDTQKNVTYYKSICGIGNASIAVNAEEKRRALDAIALKYGASCSRPARDVDVNRVNIIRIDIIEIHGKQCVEAAL